MSHVGNRVMKLERCFTQIFTDGMQSIEPEAGQPDYDIKHKAWEKSFAFKKELQIYVNDISNIIVLAGQPQRSDQYNDATKEFVKKLQEELDSSEFERLMNTAKPNIPEDDPERDEKLKAWSEAFTFSGELKKFGKKLEDALGDDGRIPSGIFWTMIDRFIEKDLGCKS